MTKFKEFDDLEKIGSIDECAEAAEEIENMVKNMVAHDFPRIICKLSKKPEIQRKLQRALINRDTVHMFQKIFEAGKVAGKLEMLAETFTAELEVEFNKPNRKVH